MLNLLLSVDKTIEVFDTIKYEHEFVPKQKFLNNFFSLDFKKLTQFDIEEIFIFNHRNTLITKEDYINEYYNSYKNNEDIFPFENLIESINVLNRSRFHLINNKQTFINIIAENQVLLLEEYLDEFMTFLIHSNYSRIEEVIILDNNYQVSGLSSKEVLKNTWAQISKMSDIEKSKPLLFEYFQKYLIDFIPDPLGQEIENIFNKNNNKKYYIWGKDEYLMNSLWAKTHNKYFSEKEYVILSNSLEFRIPVSENIFIIIRDKINADAVLKKLNQRIYINKKIYIFNFTGIEYLQFEQFHTLYIPKLSELDAVLHNIFTYFLLMSNSNDYEIVKFLIKLEGYPEFFSKLKSFPQISDIKKFTNSFSLNSKELKSVKQIKDKIIDVYKAKRYNSVNRIYWKGNKIVINFLDYQYVLKESIGLRLLIHLLDKPGRWSADELKPVILDNTKDYVNLWDTFRKGYKNFLKELLDYERKEFFQLHTLHNYLVENNIIDIKSKGDLRITSNSDPSKWNIEI